MAAARATQLRLAELLAALSLATDLANGMSHEQALKNTLLAVTLGQKLGLTGQDLSDVYYAAMLRYISCTAFAHEEAQLNAGDDIGYRNLFAGVDIGTPDDMLTRTHAGIARHLDPDARKEAIGVFLAQLPGMIPTLLAANCEAGTRLAGRLGMSQGVVTALGQLLERWDGKGGPQGLVGNEISLTARVMDFVHVVGITHRAGGRVAACATARERRGGNFDPELTDVFLAHSDELLTAIEPESVWDTVLAVEPDPRPWLPHSRLDEVARAFADFTDLKAPFMLGHSTAVANLAAASSRSLALSRPEQDAVRQAGLFHDLGMVSIPNGIWEKAGALTASEWERIRLHPHYTDRILSRSSVLAHLADPAGMHHERLDRSGYHRGLPGHLLPMSARLVAAADVYQAMIEERPFRPAREAAIAARELRSEANAGRLDREAVQAVLEVAGHPREHRRGGWPAELTDREVDVLRLVATGRTNREAGERLHISEQTIHGYVRTIYSKIAVSSRAGAALFAMENDLIRP
jgi:HD-GYP domain-containing protein (c-di-GMP phosphodiesterase class II)/DNA-binding CsgD family transcriptional regulator